MDSFDSLKREATKLERSLEDKVARYQQVSKACPPIVHLYCCSKIHAVSHQSLNFTVQLVQSLPDTGNDLLLAESGMSTSGEEEKLRHDIQRTMQSLQDLITTQLSLAADRAGAPNAALLVKRYREILFDLSGDFEKARQAHVRKQERAKLMDGARTSSNQFDDPAMELLMRERNHINNSMNAASSVIAQASEVRSDLKMQGMSLGRVQNVMGMIASNIPGLNTLVDKIRRKKTMDDKIVAGVIASCILFTLWYLFH